MTFVRSARNTMMNLIARRDHSEKELRKKLKERDFSEDEIAKAIDYAREHRWLPTTQETTHLLAEKMANGLHRKNKGIIYINHFLKEKGLPILSPDPELEVEKAKLSLQNKKSPDKAKLGRFLLARGFQMEIIRKVLK